MIQLHYHRPINVDELIYQTNEKVHLLDGALDKAQKCFEYLNQTLTQNNRSYYGINTGFGSLCNVRIEDDQLVQLPGEFDKESFLWGRKGIAAAHH